MSDDNGALAARFNWWWRFTGKQKAHVVMVVFEREWKRSAFLYELGKRITGSYEFGLPFCRLKKKQIYLLARRWPMRDRGAWSCADANATPEPGWSAYRNLSFNLTLPNKALLPAFLDFLNSERIRSGIPNPKPNSVPRRGLSWRPIELLDIKTHDIRALNDSERSQVSKAIRDYRRVINLRSDILVEFKRK